MSCEVVVVGFVVSEYGVFVHCGPHWSRYCTFAINCLQSYQCHSVLFTVIDACLVVVVIVGMVFYGMLWQNSRSYGYGQSQLRLWLLLWWVLQFCYGSFCGYVS